MFKHAVVRLPHTNFASGLTTAVWREKPDYELLCRQHRQYIDALRMLGLDVLVLDPEPDFPDAYFVEDTAVMLPSSAVITRPGAPSRAGETEKIMPALRRFRRLVQVRPPGLLDGGDVMQVETHFFIGLSNRTNQAGAQQLGAEAETQGFTWSTEPVVVDLHLKTGINYVGKNTVLCFAQYQDRPEYQHLAKIIVPADEAPAANTLLVNDALLMPAGFPKTRQRLDALDMPIYELDMSEAAKMDGGLSCMSLRF